MPEVTVSLEEAQEGMPVYCISSGAVSKAIRWVQFFAGDSDWRINHVAILDKKVDGEWHVIQAEAHGVTGTRSDGTEYLSRPLSSVAGNGTFEIRRLPLSCDPQKVLEFARSQVGEHYGFVTIASIVLTLLAPKFVNIMLADTWICSALAGESMRFGGWLHSWSDIYQVRPSQLRLYAN